MSSRVLQHFRSVVECSVIQHDVQYLRTPIPAPNPLKEGKECNTVLAFDEPAHQCVALQVVEAVHVTHSTLTAVGGPMPVHVPGAGIVLPVPGQQVQRPEFVDAEPPAAGRAALVKPPYPPVFSREFGITRLLPGLGVPPADFALVEDLPQAFDGDGRDDLLSHQISAQLGQRPDAHADQYLWRREGNLCDLLGDVAHELAG